MSRLLKQVADKPRAEAVHQLRTITRRIEALVEALDPEPEKNERRLLKRLSYLRRRAGRVRDIDVQIGLLRGLHIGRDGQEKHRLLQAMGDERSKREKKLVSSLDRETVREARRRLRKAAQNLSLFEEPTAVDGAFPFDPVAIALREFVRITRAHGELREGNLHDYRLHTKRVRYVAEMAGEDETAQRLAAELKRMQDAIGEWHDWLALTQRAEKTLEPAPESPLMSALRNVTRAKFREALLVCADARRNLLEMAQTVSPPRKSAAAVRLASKQATA